MRRGSLRGTLFAAAALAGGCWEPPSHQSPESDPIPEGFVASFAGRLCEAYVACGCPGYRDLADCTVDLQRALEDLIEDGVTFRAGCLDPWLALVDALGCASGAEAIAIASSHWMMFDQPECEPCRFEGRLSVGYRACALGLSCEFGTERCVPAGLHGTMTPLLSNGDPCTDVVLGLSCWRSDASSYCASSGRCEPRSELGAHCGHRRQCVAGSYCSGLDTQGEGHCEALRELGAPCEVTPSGTNACDVSSLPVEVQQSSGLWCAPETATCTLGRPPAICPQTTHAPWR